MFLGTWLSNHEVRQYLAAFSWNMGAMNLGIYLGWSSVTTPKLQSKTSPIFDVPLTDEEISYSTAFPIFIAITIAMLWGYLANTLGRKITGYLSALCFILCFALILKTRSVNVFIISRIIGGLSYCAVLFNGPMYIAEIAETDKLGRLSSTYLISENIGTLMIYIIGAYASFNVLNIFSLVFAFIFLVFIMFFPESPVFYLKNDRLKEARLALQWYRPMNNETYLDNELKRLNDTFVLSKNMKLSYLFSKHTLVAILIALYIQLGVQTSGINYITMYTVDIFQRSASLIDPYMATYFAGILHTIAPCLYFIITNSFGRKTIAMVSYACQGLVLGTLGWYYFYIEHNTIDLHSPLNFLPVVCISLYFLTYSAGAGCVPFTIYSEIFSSEVRNTVMPFIYIWNGVVTFIVLKFVPTLLLQTVHMSGVFWFFSISCFVTVIFTLVFIPETKGKPFLTLIDELTKIACW